MECKTHKIMILDPGFSQKSVIRDALVQHGFSVHVVATEEAAAADMESFGPDVILCRASSKMIMNKNLLCGFHDRAADMGIPFLVVTSGADVDFTMANLEHGIAHTISTPFSSEFLVSRIHDIIGEDIAVGNDVPLSIQIRFRGSEYSLTIRPSRLAKFLMCVIQDSIRHSNALLSIMQKRNLLSRSICRSDFFNGIRARTDEEIGLERELSRALEKNEFVLFYQPIINLADDRLSGFEALIRWNHPSRGLLTPDEFMPAAEHLPIIIPLGFWAIEEAARQIRSWEKMLPGGRHLQVGINLSANQFVHPGLSDSILAIMREHGVAPERMAFEITESAFMVDMESANLQLLKLKAGNHLIYMDDFGTGYSSLSYLQHFPVDTIKIDQTFVRWMHVDEQSEQIVRSVIGLAHNLKMKVVAEGIEDRQHLVMLKDLRCDCGQGYLFSVPLEPVSAEEYIHNFYFRRR